MSWADCFAEAPDDVTVEEIRDALAEHRAASDADESDATESDANGETASEPPEPSPARIVADADVLAADLCVDGDARRALDPLYRHSWTTLVASDRLLDDAEAVIESVGGQSLAADWRDCIDDWRESVDQPAGDHPALASAYRGGAMHLLSFDEGLTGSAAGAALHDRFPVSVRQPDAFALLFDPESLYEAERNGAYPGPDRDPRA
jgi:hypothetical protein